MRKFSLKKNSHQKSLMFIAENKDIESKQIYGVNCI